MVSVSDEPLNVISVGDMGMIEALCYFRKKYRTRIDLKKEYNKYVDRVTHIGAGITDIENEKINKLCNLVDIIQLEENKDILSAEKRVEIDNLEDIDLFLCKPNMYKFKTKKFLSESVLMISLYSNLDLMLGNLKDKGNAMFIVKDMGQNRCVNI